MRRRTLFALACVLSSCAGEAPAGGGEETAGVLPGRFRPDTSGYVDEGDGRDGRPERDPRALVELSGGELTLRATKPALCDDEGCSDDDADGLDDEWEAQVLARLRPALRLTDEEPLLDDGGAVGIVGRVSVVQASPFTARAVFVLAYADDYGSCGGISSHHGDPERAALLLEEAPGGDAGDVVVRALYTAAHEHTVVDRGEVVAGEELLEVMRLVEDPATGHPRPLVFSSERKHASYPSEERCADAYAVPCLAETCAGEGDGVDVLPPFVNAGEPEAPLADALDALGFAGESAWADEGFCGGHDEGPCTASVREKLVDDPFGGE